MGIFIISNQYVLLVLLFFFCQLILSKKFASEDSSSRLSECRRCKILTDSFNNWLDKTSRGKYEGGDAAWEEEKLKSYSRSEVRLVEIQEALCSDVKSYKDQCYTLAEEAEQVLEQWWFHEDPNSADLYTWLCIENLQHCCPVNHFGVACTPCPKDVDNNICGGHGRCDGDGTRKGNGTCICKTGYTGTLCDECVPNFYSTETGLCKKCHESCNGCSDDGPASCQECNSGWQVESGVCIDINECKESVCKSNEYCLNTEGSYRCKLCDKSCKTCKDDGNSNCLSCEKSHVLWFGQCVDKESRQSIMTNTFKRLALFIGLLALTLFIFLNSKSIASLIVIAIAVFLYFYKDILSHLLESLYS